MARHAKSSPDRMRVLVIDDEPAVRKGLALLLARCPGFELTGLAPNNSGAIAEVRLHHPDLVILDVRLESGTELVSALRRLFPDLRILAFAMPREHSFIQTVTDAGADIYVCRDEGAERLLAQMKWLALQPCAPLHRGIDAARPGKHAAGR